MTQHRTKIKSFLRNIIDGEYKKAHDKLSAVVEDKMKQKIKKASNKRLF